VNQEKHTVRAPVRHPYVGKFYYTTGISHKNGVNKESLLATAIGVFHSRIFPLPWTNDPGGVVWEKKFRSKISFHGPFKGPFIRKCSRLNHLDDRVRLGSVMDPDLQHGFKPLAYDISVWNGTVLTLKIKFKNFTLASWTLVYRELLNTLSNLPRIASF
jgi:hypothetical protein